MSRRFIAWGDVHFPYQNSTALELLKKTIHHFKPHVSLDLGDLLDCGQFSDHPPTHGLPQTDYLDDLRQANEFLDFVQKNTLDRTVIIEGNHEFRIARWAAKTTEGKGTYTMLCPRTNLVRGRKRITHIPYGAVGGDYPHYKLNNRMIAVHGWSYAKAVARSHLQLSQGKSVLFGHAHRMDNVCIQNLWGKDNIRAIGVGCICKRIPLYGIGNPVDWVNGFVVGYLGKHSDSVYPVDIKGNSVVLPGGKEIRV